MPDKGVGTSSDRTERDRPTRQGPKVEYVYQQSDWRALLAKRNGRERWVPSRRRSISRAFTAAASSTSTVAGEAAQNI